jgi:hypothetical protein
MIIEVSRAAANKLARAEKNERDNRSFEEKRLYQDAALPVR